MSVKEEEYENGVGKQWKIGQKGVGDKVTERTRNERRFSLFKHKYIILTYNKFFKINVINHIFEIKHHIKIKQST